MKSYFILFIFFHIHAFAHGDLDVRIEKASEAIEENPESDSLYIIRGTLFYQHEEYLKSIRDFEKAEELAGPNEVVYMSYAKSWFALKNYDFALENIDSTIHLNEENAVAYRLKAQVLMETKQFQEAAQNYLLSLQHTDKKITESYLEPAIALDSVGSPEAFSESIQLLQEGVKELGNLILFKKLIVDQSVKSGNIDQALAVQTDIIDSANRKERHYLDRAKIYKAFNQDKKAQEDIQSALIAISSLPQRYLRSKPIDKLRAELLELSQQIKSE